MKVKSLYNGSLSVKVRNEVTGDIEYHRRDRAGNYFINGKCVNPQRSALVLYTDGVWRHPAVGEFFEQHMINRKII